jgi:hypothetical protein
MQQGQPIAYYSQALGPKASTQSTYHKEALAILLALKRWRHYFLGGHLIIRTDQQSLKYMMSQRPTKGNRHKLLMKLLEFNYTIKYKKGAENRVAYVLSRKKHSVLAISSAVPSWIAKVEQSYIADSHYTSLMEQLTINTDSVPRYSISAGIIRYKGQVCIGNNQQLRTKIMEYLHSSAVGGHSGISGTYQRVKRLFYWPNLKKPVESFVSEFPIC